MINLLSRLLVATARQSFYRWRQRGKDLGNSKSLSVNFGEASCLNHNGETVAIQTPLQPYQYNPTKNNGAVNVFRWNGENFVPLGQQLLQTGDLNQNNDFGDSIALSGNGNRIAVQMPGGFFTTSPSDKCYIYDFDGAQWNLNAELGASSGIALSDNGNRLIANGIVYDYNGTTWVGTTGSGVPTGSYFAISKNGTRVANETGGIYELQNGTWNSIASLPAAVATRNTGGPYLNEDGTQFASCDGGNVKVFKESPAGTWTQLGSTFTNYLSACSFSATGRLLIKDAIVGETDKWNVKVYEFINNSWTQIAPTRFFSESRQAASVKLSGDGKTFGFGSTSSPNMRDGSNDSYSLHRKELN
jgi:hypothetical protein